MASCLKYLSTRRSIIPTCKKLYGYFADGKFEQTVANLDQLISSHVQNDPSAFNTYDEYKAAVTELTKLGKHFVRRAFKVS
ncbi:hypothetical protein P5G65_09980 [Paenibacillus chondroitinus]|uniref:Uncharacterized protein n=1 Tax=Paenibacillus chondroitinus TaxID=59842 RepID=A0ABU6DB88_9BACL|nr:MULTISPECIES: hypothetical protein [Paenibacillus]MCY9656574.1 hypothetical protein [Paenibacillus anseongense]MEB4794223.1 hypothetical protein [Paenibacillus chondroitinus]